MKNLNEYIKESLLDDFDELDKDVQQNAIKTNVLKFLIDNYILNSKPINPDDKKIKINNKPNKDGKYVVDIDGNIDIKNFDIYTLTNDLFVFGKIGGYFSCTDCKNLTSLEGAPEKVSGGFFCTDCINLTSLKGAPKEVEMSFYCAMCENLTSLEGAPKEVGEDFSCYGCDKLKNLNHLPKKIKGSLDVPDHLQK